ncbi:alpha/beta hydrolase [Mycobacterium sp. B14F4]|uniref:alpha/beta fold hydrolase n=1 Tax=Mycobacterium sp. B14F4 TaxID=3153565 RepID=UPI00325DADEC
MRRLIRVTVGLLVVLLVASTVVNHTWAKLPPMPAADGEFISLHSRQIHYVEHPGRGVPVVMIHGLPGTHRDFDPILPKLAGLHVISIDRPGFGWSRGGWLPFADQVDVVHELLTKRRLGPAVLVGHSFGAAVVLALARRYPQDVARMVLVAPGAGGMRSATPDLLQARYIQFSQLPIVGTVIDAVAGDLIKRVSATSGAVHAFEPQAVDPGYEQRLLSVTMTPGNLRAFASDQLEFDATSEWVDANVGRIEAPSVIVGAEDDQLVGIEHVRRLAETLPGAALKTVEGSHMIPYSHPDVVAAEIRRATSRP